MYFLFGTVLLSNYFTGRNANVEHVHTLAVGKYAVMEETRPGEYMPVYENERGTFIFHRKIFA